MSEIRKNILSGIFYTAISRYSNIAAGIFISAILARLLTPAEFGVVAIISVFTSFFGLLSDVGISPAIVQHKSLTEEDLSSIFLFSIALGVFLSVVFFFSAPIIASFYNEPALIILSRIMALAILFSSLQVVPNALMIKNLRFKELSIVTVIVTIITGIVAVILAYLGFSYYALILRNILSGFLGLIIFYIMAPVKPLR